MASAEETDDCDVIWKGSPLYNHLQHIGMAEEVEIREHDGIAHLTPSPHEDGQDPMVVAASEAETMLPKEDDSAHLVNSAKSFMWPDSNSLVLEVEVAKAILSSELLVQEDEEFLTNFVLTEEVMAEYNRLLSETPSKSSSLFSDIVLFSGSVAAVAGAVLYLSEKAKAATAAAAILPTALAAMTSVRIGSKVQQSQEEQHFHQLIELLLSDMKRFKQLVRKSLNLLQGMEMISSGNFLSVNPNTGATMVSTSPSCSTSQTTADDRNQLAQALCLRSNFPALRQAALKCTVQIIQAYRESVKNLMEVSPLADHVDMQEHYIAFIEMENFGIVAPNSSSEPGGHNPSQITIRELKETAQVALVQQSEYLRRFSLTFCDRVRDDHELNKAGVLKHIRDLLSTIRKLNNKLSKVLEYHQAMGFDVDKINEKQEKHKALALGKSSPSRSRSQAKFVPLRGIYTSMFSTGLHLQHTLLKLRKLEQYFDEIEKSHKSHRPSSSASAIDRSSSPFPIDEVKLLTWLGGFKEIQAELNACIGCLDEGVCQIDALQHRSQNETKRSPSSTTVSTSDLSSPSSGTTEDDNTIYMDESSEVRAFDEVFEAMSLSVNELNGIEGMQENDSNEEVKAMNYQSKMLMRELRGVLVHKAREHEFREAQALARQRNEPFGPVDGLTLPSANAFDDSFVDDKVDAAGDSSTSSSDPSDCTVKSIHITNSSAVIARSVSGQLLESDDNEGLETTEGEDVTYAEIGTDIEDFDQSEICQAVSLSSIVDSGGQNYDNHDTDQLSSCKSSAVGGVRSVSTPDLKNLVEEQSTQSGYKKFAAAAPLMSQDSEDVHSSSSSSGWESADELEHHVTLKTYRRPLRATAAAQVATKASTIEDLDNKRKKRLRQKRERNRSSVHLEPSNATQCKFSTKFLPVFIFREKRNKVFFIPI